MSADLYSPRAMCRADITCLPFKDESFDVIICYHVLEHVSDDREAMGELFRVLKPTGWTILQSPIDLKRSTTYEDPTVLPQDRERQFGQHDHVRVYGRDFKERLQQTGFDVKVDGYVRTLPAELVRRFGLSASEDIYVCTKAAGHPESRLPSAPAHTIV